MNRKISVGILIALAVSNVVLVLFASGVLSLSVNPSSHVMTTTLTGATTLTPVVSTLITPRVHQHYSVHLSVSLGDCVTTYGKTC